MVVVTEGEIDALSVSQIQGNKWPVVSVPNGAQGAAKAVARNLDYLMGFEKVIFLFDNDDPGHKAAQECAALLPPGKAYIGSLPLKDANEMLVAGRGPEVVDAIWGAKAFRPDVLPVPMEGTTGQDLWAPQGRAGDVHSGLRDWQVSGVSGGGSSSTQDGGDRWVCRSRRVHPPHRTGLDEHRDQQTTTPQP